jgi:DNA helicase-2/ATP-dependent DNA helicase PcrA
MYATPAIVLDDIQDIAANHHSGPMLLVAGAGSGKTATIVERAARMIEAGVPAERMLMLTFSRKACREMYARLRDRIEADVRGLDMPVIETYHSFGYKLIRKEPDACGRQFNPSLMDEADSKKLFKEAIVAAGLDPKDKRVNERQWRSVYDHTRNDGLDAHQSVHLGAISALLAQHGIRESDAAIVIEVFRRYESLKQDGNLLDYGDLLVLPLIGLLHNPKWADRLGRYFADIVVDEAQDTNIVQFRMVELLGKANPRHQVTMVGDDDQTIYGWRGARSENLTHFIEAFKPDVVRLERNYRSPDSIVAPATRMVRNNLNRVEKTPYSALSEPGAPARYMGYENGDVMADAIAASIRYALDRGLRPKECAILYRTNRMARVLEPALIAHGIPYRIQQGFDLFNRAEAQMAFACMRLATNPWDYPAFRKLATLIDGFGEKRVESVIKAYRDQPADARKSLFDVAANLMGGKSASSQAVADMGARIERLSNTSPHLISIGQWALSKDGGDFGPWLKKLARQSNNPRQNLESRIETLTSIDRAMRSRVEGLSFGDLPARECWAQVLEMALSTPDEEDSHDVVVLSTVHKAKGLEWSVVHVPGFSEGMMPSLRQDDLDDEEGAEGLEEERRLAYVTCTRAKRTLVLHHAPRIFMGYETIELQPSRFANEAGFVLQRSGFNHQMGANTVREREMALQLADAGWDGEDFDVQLDRQPGKTNGLAQTA